MRSAHSHPAGMHVYLFTSPHLDVLHCLRCQCEHSDLSLHEGPHAVFIPRFTTFCSFANFNLSLAFQDFLSLSPCSSSAAPSSPAAALIPCPPPSRGARGLLAVSPTRRSFASYSLGSRFALRIAWLLAWPLSLSLSLCVPPLSLCLSSPGSQVALLKLCPVCVRAVCVCVCVCVCMR